MKLIRPALMLTLLFVVAAGLVFPLLIYGIAQAVFPHHANGSLVKDAKGNVIGSELIGQSFADPKYFHPRPSAAGSGYDGAGSGGTNLGPTSDKLVNGIHDPKNQSGDFDGIVDLAKRYRAENGLAADAPLPADVATRSGSGLDPDISPANAEFQAARIALARDMPTSQVQDLIHRHTRDRFAGIFGEPRVNVLELNLALDKEDASHGR